MVRRASINYSPGTFFTFGRWSAQDREMMLALGADCRPNLEAGSDMTTQTVGLIMSGGGARAAYQVGVLRGIARLLPQRERNPFGIICGTSAGAVNAASLASKADRFDRAVARGAVRSARRRMRLKKQENLG